MSSSLFPVNSPAVPRPLPPSLISHDPKAQQLADKVATLKEMQKVVKRIQPTTDEPLEDWVEVTPLGGHAAVCSDETVGMSRNGTYEARTNPKDQKPETMRKILSIGSSLFHTLSGKK